MGLLCTVLSIQSISGAQMGTKTFIEAQLEFLAINGMGLRAMRKQENIILNGE